MTVRNVSRPIALLLAAMAVMAQVALPAPARAADFSMETEASYAVRPADGEIDVRVNVTFTNTTRNPTGRFSVFDRVRIAVHDEATAVTAQDDDGELDVATGVRSDVYVATVFLREDLRYEDTATFELAYTLPDTDDPQLRVRPSVVVFPAWSFGTSGEVTVEVPEDYEIRVDGDPLTAEGDVLASGPIEDATQWLALVTAVQPAEYASFDATVPLAGGTADLTVRAFSDDEAWGERTLALITEALPLLEEEIGLPYPEVGQLVVTESVTTDASGFGESAGLGAEIAVAFDQPQFTALHQVAHVWLSEDLIESRWLREGLASDAAARVAERLGIEPPFEPGAEAQAREEAAFPLDAWAPTPNPDEEAYGYAASWAFVDELEAAVGIDAIRAVLGRAVASVGPYESADVVPDPAPDEAASPPLALDTRSFLDHLETVSGTEVSELLVPVVLTETDAGRLPLRTEARTAYADLAEAAGSWGVPDPIVGAMSAWDFEDAVAQIEVARDWLGRRDDLLDEMRAAGLAAPDRLQQAYRSYGGAAEAEAELEAERDVVAAYADTAADVNGERTFLERIGLLGGPDAASELVVANGRLADGDLRGSLQATSEARRILAAAETGGVVRIASALLLAVIALAVAIILVRRRSAYTGRR